MNEKIKKLFNEATFEEDRLIDGIYHPYIPLQFAGEPFRFAITSEQYHKFAELIIEECIKICDKVQNTYGQYTFTATVCKEEINQNFFGIE